MAAATHTIAIFSRAFTTDYFSNQSIPSIIPSINQKLMRNTCPIKSFAYF